MFLLFSRIEQQLVLSLYSVFTRVRYVNAGQVVSVFLDHPLLSKAHCTLLFSSIDFGAVFVRKDVTGKRVLVRTNLKSLEKV